MAFLSLKCPDCKTLVIMSTLLATVDARIVAYGACPRCAQRGDTRAVSTTLVGKDDRKTWLACVNAGVPVVRVTNG